MPSISTRNSFTANDLKLEILIKQGFRSRGASRNRHVEACVRRRKEIRTQGKKSVRESMMNNRYVYFLECWSTVYRYNKIRVVRSATKQN